MQRACMRHRTKANKNCTLHMGHSHRDIVRACNNFIWFIFRKTYAVVRSPVNQYRCAKHTHPNRMSFVRSQAGETSACACVWVRDCMSVCDVENWDRKWRGNFQYQHNPYDTHSVVWVSREFFSLIRNGLNAIEANKNQCNWVAWLSANGNIFHFKI